MASTPQEQFIRLREAIKRCDKTAIRHLLLMNAPVNPPRSSSGYPLLHWAIMKSHDAEIIQMLIDRDANIHAKSRDKSTLELATECNQVSTVKILLNTGKCTQFELQGAINAAIAENKMQVSNILIDHAIKTFPSMNLANCCPKALTKGDLCLIKKLMPHCKFERNNYNQIPNEIIVNGRNNYKDCINFVLKHGFIINREMKKDANLIFSAAEKGYTEIIKQLINLGIDVNMRNKANGFTLLHVACLHKHQELAELLIKHKALVNSEVTAVQTKKKTSGYRAYIKNQHVGKTCLYFAVNNGDINLTRLLLNNRATVNQDPNCFKLISTAIENGYKEIAESLLSHVEEVNVSNEDGKTFLHSCCAIHRIDIAGPSNEIFKYEIAKYLLERGANVNAQTRQAITPLFDAIKNGFIEIAKLFLDNNADLQHVDAFGNTVFHIAANSTNPSFVELFENREININPVNKYGETPLHIACNRLSTNDILTVEKLLNLGANIDSVDGKLQTALHLACSRSHIEMVQMLLAYGAQVNFADKNGKTPLHIACEKQSREIIENLLASKADPNSKDENNKTPLHYAASTKVNDHTADIIKILLSHNADINALDTEMHTALYYACKIGNETAITTLLENKADINLVDIKGQSVLASVVDGYYFDSRILEILLKYKPNVDFTNAHGESLLHIIARKNFANLVSTLINFNINVDRRDYMGNTALHVATKNNHPEMVETLLNHGADVNVLNFNRLTAFQLAFNKVDELIQNHSQIENRRNSYDDDDYYRRRRYEISDEEEELSMCKNELRSARQMIKMMQEHVIKLKCIGFEVNRQNMYLTYDFVLRDDYPSDSSESDENLDVEPNDFEEECEDEIEQLKNEFIAKNVCIYDLLVKSIEWISKYARNEDMMQTLSSQDYSNKFPVYIIMVRNKFSLAVARNNVMDTAMTYSMNTNLRCLPHNCVYEIFNYLTKEELNTFISVVDPAANSVQ